MKLKLNSGVTLTVHNESVAQQYLKHGAVEVKPEEPVNKSPKKVKRSATKVPPPA